MPRCGCASDQCGCNFVAGDGVVISGTGSRSNPYVIEAVVPVSSGGGGTDGRFTGEITMYGGATPPAGWLLCDGRAVNRAVYSGLYDVIGTSFGAGDGTTTFNLPNYADRMPIGANTTDHQRGYQAGSLTHTLTPNNLPTHHHTIADHSHNMNHGHSGSIGAAGGHDHTALYNTTDGSDVGTYRTGALGGRANDNGALINWMDNHTHGVSINAYNANTGGSGVLTTSDIGANEAIDHMPPTTATNFIIKV